MIREQTKAEDISVTIRTYDWGDDMMRLGGNEWKTKAKA